MSYLEELRMLRNKHPTRGLIAHEVVDYARDPNTALHARFDWDDTHAANLYRLTQARALIRIVVNVIEDPKSHVIHRAPLYVSLSDHRGKEQGYYTRAEIVSDDQKRCRHALDVLKNIISILSRAALPELEDVLATAQAAEIRIIKDEEEAKEAAMRRTKKARRQVAV